MWPRVVECMLGCWLLISPFVFRYDDQPIAWWINDHAVGLCIILFGLMSYWRRTSRIHLLTLVAALWLILYGRLGHQFPFPPAAQNYITVGLLLLMTAIIPNNSMQPPAAWFRDLTAAGSPGSLTGREKA